MNEQRNEMGGFDLEGYPIWVDAIMLWQGGIGINQCQDGSLVQKLETRVTGQELVLVKGLWEP